MVVFRIVRHYNDCSEEFFSVFQPFADGYRFMNVKGFSDLVKVDPKKIEE